MIEKISNSVRKFIGNSNIYVILLDKPIVIDAGNRADKQLVEKFLGKLIDLNQVEKVIFTHLHYDHIGNFDLFPNAKFYASKAEIESFKKDPMGTVLDEDTIEKFNVELHPITSDETLEVIETPGHTAGSICLWFDKEKVLFSGDTLLKGGTGRTDLPSSQPEEMQKSILKLIKYTYKYLATGHEY